ncbi:GNAT family N-acetyltransferase [Lysinibacillus telephonicus]|uniref:GNAT family N-acetyltransferase n=1 Tax=Lysinibacillus telephonicus TaxID=1714840 RepID=A0A3S0HQ78_9BACI|nr:GNAT family N-acetyltransferase [Lysinibacillus telephonicus]RTQ96488.1 GNAT family N-acetyltransferase [Lysinibacillus telephonicus]
MGESFADFLFDLERQWKKRHYSKNEIKDLDTVLKMETKKIEDDSEKLILNVLHKNGEHIIVYLNKLDQSEIFRAFFIELKVINKKGIVLNRIRLSAKFNDEETIELCDIEVIGENEGRGYGTILLNSLINFAIDNSIKTILGWISYADKDHFDKLDYFYKKHGFNVIWGNDNTIVNKAADIIWIKS